VQVFGFITKILPGGQMEGSLEHVDFYLYALNALAGRKPLQTLFTVDDKTAISMVRFILHSS
jgi:hypothetical protein